MFGIGKKKKPRRAPAKQEEVVEQGVLFFGTLPSEFETTSTEAPSLVKLRNIQDEVLENYLTGRLTPEESGRILGLLVLPDKNGLQWSIGATTGRWYRRLPGGTWRSASPGNIEEDEELAGAAGTIAGVVKDELDRALGR